MFENFSLDDPKTQGLLAAAASMFQNSGPSRMPQSLGGIFGQALTAGMGGYQGAKQGAFDQQVAEMKRKKMEEDYSMDSLKNQILRSDTERQRSAETDLLSKIEANPDYKFTQGDIFKYDPSAAFRSRIGNLDSFAVTTQYINHPDGTTHAIVTDKAGNIKDLGSVSDKMQFLAPTESTPGAFANLRKGDIVPIGGASGLPFPPIERRGSRQETLPAQFILPPIPPPNAKQTLGITPLSIRESGLAGFNRPLEKKAPSGYSYTDTGNLTPIKGGPADELPVGQVKQVAGVKNLQSAIQEYRNELKNFGLGSILLPDSRAIMGTKYNNMMLQAKEAYNLGVLNGQDLTVLTSVVTNPASLTGAMTSNKALDTQASELDRIMTGIGQVAAERNPKVVDKNTSPPKAAINLLRMNPKVRDQFDAKYGAGAAASILGQ